MHRVGLLVLAAVCAASVLAGGALAGAGNSASAQDCQKEGWQVLTRGDGTSFASEEACVSYAAQGGTLIVPQWFRWDAVCMSYGATPHLILDPARPDSVSCDFFPAGVSPSNTLIKSFEAACAEGANDLGNTVFSFGIILTGSGKNKMVISTNCIRP
jgi:hypothetical protein